MAELDVAQVSRWCESLAPAVGSDLAKKISEYVARKQLDGDHLAGVLRLPQDFVSDAQIDGLTMVPANKVRKAWFREFPLTRRPSVESCSVQDHHSSSPPMWDSPDAAASETSLEPCASLPSITSTAPPVPIVDEAVTAVKSGMKIVALSASPSTAEPYEWLQQNTIRQRDTAVPPPPSRAPPLPKGRQDSSTASDRDIRDMGERRKGQQETMGSVRIVGIDGGGPQQNLTAMLWLQAVIDRLASKANLDRRSAYREIEDLLPEWMWNHLWGAVETTVPKRESGSSSDGDTSAYYGAPSTSSATPGSSPIVSDVRESGGARCPVSSESDGFDVTLGEHRPPVGRRRLRKRAAPKKSPKEVSKEALVGIEILRAALAGTDMPIRMLRPEPSRGQGPAVRKSSTGASHMTNTRRSSLLGEPKKRPSIIESRGSPTCRPSIGGDKNPEQLAEWIRALPSTQIPSPKLSELADTILSNGIDGPQMTGSAGLRDLGICNPLESRKLDRFWQNVLAETRAAECARDNAGHIRTGGIQVTLK